MCLVALVVLAFMSIFSAKYRSWTKEAFDCVARRLTLRPCRTSFNEKVKAKITGTLMKRNMGVARFTHKHFEAISWVFTIVMFVSLAYTAYGFYNLATIGTCDPITGNCIFNPGGDPNKVLCAFDELEPEEAVPTLGGFMDIESAGIGKNGKVQVYFFGTTWCPHCGWERPIFTDVAEKFSGFIELSVVEIDIEAGDAAIEIFTHYSPEGKIPVQIIGGKYYRIGAGESLGEEQERQVLTALFCKATGSPIDECGQPDVIDLMEHI